MTKFKVGDIVKQHNYNRPGKITKIVAIRGKDDAVYEVEFEPVGKDPGRTDRFYQNQLTFSESLKGSKFKVGDNAKVVSSDKVGKVSEIIPATDKDEAKYVLRCKDGKRKRYYGAQLEKVSESAPNKEIIEGLQQYLEDINEPMTPEMPPELPKKEPEITENPLRKPIEFETPLEIDKPKKPKDCSLKFVVKDKNGNSDIKEVSCNGIKVFEYITRDGQISLPSEYSMFSALANFVQDKMGEKEE